MKCCFLSGQTIVVVDIVVFTIKKFIKSKGNHWDECLEPRISVLEIRPIMVKSFVKSTVTTPVPVPRGGGGAKPSKNPFLVVWNSLLVLLCHHSRKRITSLKRGRTFFGRIKPRKSWSNQADPLREKKPLLQKDIEDEWSVSLCKQYFKEIKTERDNVKTVSSYPIITSKNRPILWDFRSEPEMYCHYHH